MTDAKAILIIEDDPDMRDTCARMLSRAGYTTEAVADGEAALTRVKTGPGFCVALLDLKLPKMDGSVVLERLVQLDSALKVVIMTGFATVGSAVQTMKAGAVDYLVKPFEKEELLAVVAQQVRVFELEQRVERLQSELHSKYRFDNIAGHSKAMEPVFARMMAARNNKANVLIVGESGTGKELIARAIHYNGPCPEGPFVAVNCAALPESLIESELFGHTKGAFTGAARDSIGLFRAAHGGTILLDEVIDMPLDTQAKLLRVVQERSVRPVGGLSENPIDVRIIAATNRDPAEAVERGRLRKDLFYRLSVITIAIPPLRQRPEDIPDFIAHFSATFAKTYSFRIGPVDQRVLDALNQYSWPGNVRQLENLVEQWFALRHTGPITTRLLPEEFLTQAQPQPKETAAADAGTIIPLRNAEHALVQEALKAAGDNKSRAANLLGISRKRLYKILGSDSA